MTAPQDPSAGDPYPGFRPPADSGSSPLSGSYDPTAGYHGGNGYPSGPVQYPAPGSTGQFGPVGQFDQTGLPPVAAGYDPAAYSPPPYGQAPYVGGYGVPTPFGQAPQNGLGTAALVLGIIGVLFCWNPLGFILGVLAIIFGSIGRGRAKRGQATNQSSATAGLVLGVVAVALLLILLVIGAAAYTTAG